MLPVVGGIALLAFLSCSADDDTTPLTTASPGVSSSLPALETGDVASLLQFYAYAGSSPNDVNIERQRVIESCMRDQGWEYYPPPEEVLRSSEPNELQALRAYRSSRGYGISITVQTDFNRDTDRNLAYVRTLSEGARSRYYTSLNGGSSVDANGPPGGCEQQANEAVEGALPIFDQNVQSVLPYMAADLSADPRYQTATAAWSRCMSGQGFSFDSPDAARESMSRELTRAIDQGEITQLQDEEVRVAQADFDCAVAHLTPVENSINAELIQRYIDAGRMQPSFTEVSLP